MESLKEEIKKTAYHLIRDRHFKEYEESKKKREHEARTGKRTRKADADHHKFLEDKIKDYHKEAHKQISKVKMQILDKKRSRESLKKHKQKKLQDRINKLDS